MKERDGAMRDTAQLVENIVIDPLVGHPPDFHVFHQFLERCKALPRISVAVCFPLTDVALNGALEAANLQEIAKALRLS